MGVIYKSASELDKMRKSGRIVRQVLKAVEAAVAPGVTTMDLERVAEKKIHDLGAKPAFKGYFDYPCVLCTSVNEQIVHGIPSEKRMLKEGALPHNIDPSDPKIDDPAERTRIMREFERHLSAPTGYVLPVQHWGAQAGRTRATICP